MKRQKKYTAMLLVTAMLFALLAGATGCGKDEEEAEITVEPAVQTPVLQVGTQAPAEVTPEQSAEPVDSTPAQLEVTQSVAYYFPSTQSLYAAIEYENTGASAACLEEVSLTFNTGARQVEATFTPMLNTDDFIYPGEKGSLAYWRKYDGESGLDFDSPIALENIALAAINRPADRADLRLLVQDCTVIQNYPDFATLTGNVINEGEIGYALTLIYASFYDEQDNLIGVWHFTKNMALRADSKRNFSVHLEALPIPDLEARTARIDSRGVGIE